MISDNLVGSGDRIRSRGADDPSAGLFAAAVDGEYGCCFKLRAIEGGSRMTIMVIEELDPAAIPELMSEGISKQLYLSKLV